MNFTEYIRHIVQLRGYSFAYGDAREINRVLTTIDFSQSKNGIVAFAHLITEDENDDHARATLAVYFCHLCPFDFDANDTGEWQGYLRNAANTMFSDISAGNIARTSNMRYSYGYDDYAENVLWVCARFTIEALQCGCNEFVFRDEIVKNIEYVRTLENGDYEYKITFTDGSTQMFASPRGPKGGDGEPGPPGPPGTTDYNELQNKPTKLSDFENDEGFITSEYHDASKQDTITDLATIRSGAAAGETAVQPSAISDMETRTHAAGTYVAKESGKGLSSNDYTTAEKSKLAGIEAGAQKNPTAVSQLENDAQYLKLQEVKPNGNIVLTDGVNIKEYMAATPSGDPMHYAYVAAGAEYNATGADIVKTAPWGDQVTHKAGYWYLNGLGDLTNVEMVKILNYGYVFGNTYQFYLQGRAGTKTNLAKENNTMAQTAISLYGVVYQNTNIIVFSLSKSGVTTVNINNFYIAFQNCTNLEIITDILNVSGATTASNTFLNCGKLRYVMLKNLKLSVDLGKSSLLYNSCILYMIENAQTTANFTITLHADAYARAMADADIQAALAAKPNVSLASA